MPTDHDDTIARLTAERDEAVRRAEATEVALARYQAALVRAATLNLADRLDAVEDWRQRAEAAEAALTTCRAALERVRPARRYLDGRHDGEVVTLTTTVGALRQVDDALTATAPVAERQASSDPAVEGEPGRAA